MNTFTLEVVTPYGRFYRDKAVSVTFMSSEGEVEVLSGHEPLVVAIEPCVLRAAGRDGKWTAAVGEGFARIKPSAVTIIVDSAELPASIDVERARAALQRARERIGLDSAAWIRIQSNKGVARALARLKATGTEPGRMISGD
jgi:F-type H+-transporting ATPase subunit epsilon